MNREELLQIIDQAARSGRTTLDLGGKSSRLPQEIGRLTNLTALYLHNNQLTVCPQRWPISPGCPYSASATTSSSN